ncbi:hypothetical protein C2I18_01085 [Paenibacillus sp. PK3_47]|uniref:ArsR/SmtB family transcription factor n=1 Tax=Paenibacillus sp. PK3_47 TaxID=2072642 RepID=UPI00201E71FD|nr:winged helix-turn-helix domain-containing protein [Paenibacillus sp. PK3_47]UQZ32261.1 hypothetical protein C2I18_01085 [Paenibacillus sp. PK3_47]
MAPHLNDTLRKNITFAYNEALEFVVSLGMIACEGQLLAVAEDYKLEMDPMALAYHEEARTRLSPHAYRELQFFFGYNFFHKALDFAFYESVCSYAEPLSVEMWLARLEESPAEKTVSEMVYGVYHDHLDELLQGHDWEVAKHDIPLLAGLVRNTEPLQEVAAAQEPLLECLNYPEECKLRYMQFLRQFHKDIFSHWSDALRNESEQGRVYYEPLFQDNPERFIREINTNDPAQYDIPTTFHISFMSQVGNYFLHLYKDTGELGWVVFGIHNEQAFGPPAAREKVELFLKAFSDKRRLDFLLLLKKRPHYGQEIAAALGITPAAVNYHANFLFFLGLIELKREDHRLYYHLHTDKLEELLSLTSKVMLDEGY